MIWVTQRRDAAVSHGFVVRNSRDQGDLEIPLLHPRHVGSMEVQRRTYSTPLQATTAEQRERELLLLESMATYRGRLTSLYMTLVRHLMGPLT